MKRHATLVLKVCQKWELRASAPRVLGLLLEWVAFLWKGNPYFGLLAGVSLAAKNFVAVGFGGLVPLFLRCAGTDPALASGPLLTTITDMCGFFFVLSFASVLLSRLSV